MKQINTWTGESVDDKPFKLLEQYSNERKDFFEHILSYFGKGDIVKTTAGKIYTVDRQYSKKKNKQDIRVVDVIDSSGKMLKAIPNFYFTPVK